MDVRKLLINEISILAGGASPFDIGAEELEFYDHRRMTWYQDNKDLFESKIHELLINKVKQSEIEPLPLDFFEDEFIELIRLINNPEIRKKTSSIVILNFPTSQNKAFDFDVLAELNQSTLWDFLNDIKYQTLTKSELLSYIHAIGATRVPAAVDLLNAIESNDPDILNEISIAREKIIM